MPENRHSPAPSSGTAGLELSWLWPLALWESAWVWTAQAQRQWQDHLSGAAHRHDDHAQLEIPEPIACCSEQDLFA
jgi:hypothetical protein